MDPNRRENQSEKEKDSDTVREEIDRQVNYLINNAFELSIAVHREFKDFDGFYRDIQEFTPMGRAERLWDKFKQCKRNKKIVYFNHRGPARFPEHLSHIRISWVQEINSFVLIGNVIKDGQEKFIKYEEY